MEDRTVGAWGLPEAGGDIHPETETGLTGSAAGSNGRWGASLVFGRWVCELCPSGWGCSLGCFVAGVFQIQATAKAFAALRIDQRVVAWGADGYGGNASAVQTNLTDVTNIYSNEVAFAAVHSDGGATTWGADGAGGSFAHDKAKCPELGRVFHTDFAFFAECLRTSGGPPPEQLGIAWGDPDYGGEMSEQARSLLAWSDAVTIKAVTSTGFAFAVLLSNGVVAVWGDDRYGGACTRPRPRPSQASLDAR